MFLVRFFLTLIGLFIVWSFIVFLQCSNPTVMSQWIYDVYEKKTNIANSIKKKKIVIVSGSNALFGINSKMMEQSLGIRVVNFGVNAGVMLPYTLYKAKKIIDKGDIVLMPLEYPMYSYNGVPNAQMIDYIFSRDMNAFWWLTLKEQFLMVWNISLSRLYNGYIYKGGSPITTGLYKVGNINQYGDQINTSVKYRTKQMREKLDRFEPKKYGRDYKSKALGWKYLEDFIFWCRDRDVEVIFMPSTIMRCDNYYSDEKERWFYKNIANEVQDRGWRYIGNPYDYMYDKNFYFNTPFHLIDKGREIRTKKIIKDLEYNLNIRSYL